MRRIHYTNRVLTAIGGRTRSHLTQLVCGRRRSVERCGGVGGAAFIRLQEFVIHCSLALCWWSHPSSARSAAPLGCVRVRGGVDVCLGAVGVQALRYTEFAAKSTSHPVI